MESSRVAITPPCVSRAETSQHTPPRDQALSWQPLHLDSRQPTGHIHRQMVVSLMPRRPRPQWSKPDARPFKLLPRGLVAAANLPVPRLLAGNHACKRRRFSDRVWAGATGTRYLQQLILCVYLVVSLWPSRRDGVEATHGSLVLDDRGGS
jgi:hypothetical protein